MKYKLSEERIESFCGNVIPLSLEGEGLAQQPIDWSCDENEILLMRTFSHEKGAESAANCVLLTLMKPGKATVTASFDGEEYRCEVFAREMICAGPDTPLEYYVGDFHDHLSTIHNHQLFAERDAGFPIDLIRRIKEDERMDFAVISDHASTTNDRDFFLGFAEARREESEDAVILPGSEAEVTVVEEDRFGIPFKNSGEIVCVNSSQYRGTRSWEAFYKAMAEAPCAVGVLAHPYIAGHVIKGIWNFSLHKNNGPELRHLIKGIESGNGGLRHANPINEYVYSLALDNGFRVSLTCSSDCHAPKWGYDIFPGKTVIMAYEKSKEAFLDALFARRFYATESGNVRVHYTVNGMGGASTLPLTDTYRFHVSATLFHDDPSCVPTACRVISDYGKTVAEFENEDFSSFDFEIRSETARYFYLRFTDDQGRRTWSCPIWTSRPIDAPCKKEYVPLDKTGFTVLEEESGKDASVLVNGNPLEKWCSELPSATYLIDMKQERKFSALGHYSPYVIRKECKELGVDMCEFVALFVSKFEISTSSDGIHFEPCAQGQLRVFSGEEIISFAPQKARYIRFRAVNTTGAEWRKSYADRPLQIAELSVFE
ncbi:MAG: hypothetical protein E7580_09120 [Ruminococcaceae bacterium]|nr:hypothetical protein [Oscillospiraceae bacterium]